ncbi:MAG: hypothetical protein ACJAT2_001207 [Bacteriovoracaceae bacterium]|jgi:hypothetical protein
MKYLLITFVFLSLSCQKEEKSKAAPAVITAQKALSIVQYYCGYYANGCEDFAEDSVHISIVNDKKIHIARRFSESEAPFSWGFSGEYEKEKTDFILLSDPAFSKAVNKLSSGVVAREGSYDGPYNFKFKCEKGRSKCSVSGYPAEMPGSAFESSMLSFDLKCNQVALKDNSVSEAECNKAE